MPYRLTVQSVQSRSAGLLALLLFISLLAASGSRASEGNNTILVMGDSISAAYGMSLDEGWVALLARRLSENHPGYSVVNASISGETSAGAAARLPSLLEEHKPAVVILELGGNDGLRGYPVKRLKANLVSMAEQSREVGAGVLILAMEIPPNYGARYTKDFRASFQQAATATNSAMSPFMLDGVATDRGLMQNDGIHPTVEAQALLLDNVWPHLEPLLSD